MPAKGFVLSKCLIRALQIWLQPKNGRVVVNSVYRLFTK